MLNKAITAVKHLEDFLFRFQTVGITELKLGLAMPTLLFLEALYGLSEIALIFGKETFCFFLV